jgi:translation initiation factor IF-1
MPKEETIKIEGKVEELLPNMTFRVALTNGMQVLAHLINRSFFINFIKCAEVF